VGKTKVTISKDGKFATITFNQAFLSQQDPGSAPRISGQPIAALPSPFVQRSVAQQVPHRHTRRVTQGDPKATGAPESVPLPAPSAGVAPPNLARLPTSDINLSGAPK